MALNKGDLRVFRFASSIESNKDESQGKGEFWQPLATGAGRTEALACKLAKAAWHLMAEKVDYDQKRIFPQECGRAAVSQGKGLVKNPEN